MTVITIWTIDVLSCGICQTKPHILFLKLILAWVFDNTLMCEHYHRDSSLMVLQNTGSNVGCRVKLLFES